MKIHRQNKFKAGDIIIAVGANYPNHTLLVDRYDEFGCLWAHPPDNLGVQHNFVLDADRNFRVVTKREMSERRSA
jgi:hypothetical protein